MPKSKRGDALRKKVTEAVKSINCEVTREFQAAHVQERNARARVRKAEEEMEKLLRPACRVVEKYIRLRAGYVTFDGRPFYIDYSGSGRFSPRCRARSSWKIRKHIRSASGSHQVIVECQVHPWSIEHIDAAIADLLAAAKAIQENTPSLQQG